MRGDILKSGQTTTDNQSLTTILSLQNITKSFDGVVALDGVNLEFGKGSVNAIIGPNGSGKTTLFNVISGFLKPDFGKVVFRGKNITYLSPYRIARRGIGRTFQLIRIFSRMTVMENMLLALENARKEGLFYALNPLVKYDSTSLEEKAVKLISLGEIEDKADELAINLSHGQRRLLEILRAIALNADLYLFDEPTAGVFPEVRERILKIFDSLKDEGKTIIFIEHNMETVRDAERVIVLDKGQVIADGFPGEVLESDVVIDAYFGGAK